jgi:AcrR family transcriptional regulator
LTLIAVPPGVVSKLTVSFLIVTRINSISSTVIPSRRGRPRSESAKAAILAAGAAILEEQGLRGTSVDAVAARAGVSKATIYRWWRSKEDLALDIYLADMRQRIPLPDTGNLAADLRTRARATARAFSSRNLGPVLAELIGEAQADPAFGLAFRDRVIRPLREESLAILKRAQARGEIGSEIPVEVALDVLVGPLYYRLLLHTGRLDARFADQVVDLLLAGLGIGAKN